MNKKKYYVFSKLVLCVYKWKAIKRKYGVYFSNGEGGRCGKYSTTASKSVTSHYCVCTLQHTDKKLNPLRKEQAPCFHITDPPPHNLLEE